MLFDASKIRHLVKHGSLIVENATMNQYRLFRVKIFLHPNIPASCQPILLACGQFRPVKTTAALPTAPWKTMTITNQIRCTGPLFRMHPKHCLGQVLHVELDKIRTGSQLIRSTDYNFSLQFNTKLGKRQITCRVQLLPSFP